MHPSKTSRPNQVRIIGGTYRSRKLSFPPILGLRPTGDRIRETLFNWLAPVIPGSHCLDLFAGSGALGLEALSRGAAQVAFIDSSQQACASLRQNLNLLDSTLLSSGKATVLCTDSLRWLSANEPDTQLRFNIAFLDPPFAADLFDECCKKLRTSHLLSPDALIYLEQPKQRENLTQLSNWWPEKDKCSGNVRYQLFRQP